MRTSYVGWGAVIFFWTMASVFLTITLFANAILGVTMGAFLGWLFSLTFLGRWIVQGLGIFRLQIHPADLYQIGAAAGFISSFFKFSAKAPEWKKGGQA